MYTSLLWIIRALDNSSTVREVERRRGKVSGSFFGEGSESVLMEEWKLSWVDSFLVIFFIRIINAWAMAGFYGRVRMAICAER